MGTFVISLDFELHWGVRDHRTVADYRENLLGVRRVVPALLSLFSEFGIHATWATVGLPVLRQYRRTVSSTANRAPALRRSEARSLRCAGRDWQRRKGRPVSFRSNTDSDDSGNSRPGDCNPHVFSLLRGSARSKPGIISRRYSSGTIRRQSFRDRDQKHRFSTQPGHHASRADLR